MRLRPRWRRSSAGRGARRPPNPDAALRAMRRAKDKGGLKPLVVRGPGGWFATWTAPRGWTDTEDLFEQPCVQEGRLGF